ncbi:MAG: hypothetical protein RIQ40_1465, partial [Planctomycetota bacterium]
MLHREHMHLAAVNAPLAVHRPPHDL